MPKARPTRFFTPLVVILLSVSLGALAPPPARAAGVQTPSPLPPVAGAKEPSIHIAWRATPEERARREAQARAIAHRNLEAERRRIATLRPELETWTRRYEPAARPLRAALAEAIAYLARGRGPESQTVCLPIADALAAVTATQPAPDPHLDHQLATALATLRTGADACARGLPATGLSLLRAGEKGLAEADTLLLSYRK